MISSFCVKIASSGQVTNQVLPTHVAEDVEVLTTAIHPRTSRIRLSASWLLLQDENETSWPVETLHRRLITDHWSRLSSPSCTIQVRPDVDRPNSWDCNKVYNVCLAVWLILAKHRTSFRSLWSWFLFCSLQAGGSSTHLTRAQRQSWWDLLWCWWLQLTKLSFLWLSSQQKQTYSETFLRFLWEGLS